MNVELHEASYLLGEKWFKLKKKVLIENLI